MEQKLLQTKLTGVKFDESGLKFSGYASVFNGVDSYNDTIIKGAYAGTLQDREREIKMRWNHIGPVIGKWTEIKEDDTGLLVAGELTPGHSLANDVAASMKHGAVDGMSIGYYVTDSEQKGKIRELKEIELIEISVVEEPADNSARVSELKNLNQCQSLKEVERSMRKNFGLSQTEATAIVSAVKNVLRRDGDEQSEEKQILDYLKSLKLGV